VTGCTNRQNVITLRSRGGKHLPLRVIGVGLLRDGHAAAIAMSSDELTTYGRHLIFICREAGVLVPLPVPLPSETAAASVVHLADVHEILQPFGPEGGHAPDSASAVRESPPCGGRWICLDRIPRPNSHP
jgi:hypothetical protein